MKNGKNIWKTENFSGRWHLSFLFLSVRSSLLPRLPIPNPSSSTSQSPNFGISIATSKNRQRTVSACLERSRPWVQSLVTHTHTHTHTQSCIFDLGAVKWDSFQRISMGIHIQSILVGPRTFSVLAIKNLLSLPH
jgi:hypothetical protein